MKLISMTDFVLSVVNADRPCDRGKMLDEIGLYAEFLKQPLKLEMFVPCDDEGNVLEEPIYTTNHSDECYCRRCEEETKRCSDLQDQYKKAKEKVLFEFDGGLTLLRNKENFFIIEDKNGVYYRVLKNKTKANIERLFKFSVDITLTPNATKQIGL